MRKPFLWVSLTVALILVWAVVPTGSVRPLSAKSDVSTPAAPALTGDHVYLADADGGLLILRFREQISLVSVSSEGEQGNGDSWGSAISDDGRYVVFSSMASNLVMSDNNSVEDIFVHDRETGITERVSVNSKGQEVNGISVSPAISADGRCVAFVSAAGNLVADDTNDLADTFLHDRQTGETTRVSVASDGTQGDAASSGDAPALSADGRYVAFGSYAGNLVPEGDHNGSANPDVYVHDRLTQETRRVSLASDGTQGNNWSWKPDISSDGRFVTFSSWSNNLVSGDTNSRIDVFVHDLHKGETSRVSLSSSGEEGNGDAQYSAISGDGRYVAFGSDASNLIPNDTNGQMDIFVHDRQTGQTTLASVASDGTQGDNGSIHADISGNGRYVLFDSIAGNLVSGDTNDQMDLFLYDRLTGITTRVSVAADGTEGNDSSRLPSIADDGCAMSFASFATNLVSGDTNGFQDIFVYTQTCAPRVDVDLDVTFINRTPLYKAYCVEYMYDAPNQPGRPFLCPGTENDRRWPEPGEVVTFTAHVVNKGYAASPAFGYVWHIDGAEVASGTLPALSPAAEITATYQWPWGHDLSPDGQRALGEHAVRFTVDPSDAIDETYESNNSLEDRTNAMSFSIYITPEMYEAYNIPVDPRYPYSAEDWLQKQIAAMNANFANSIYPVAPQGATLRVRINTIGVTPTDPGPDGEHDGGWFVTGDYRHGVSAWYDPATDIDWALIHELSHQVSLIDLYAIGVYAANVFVLGHDGTPANIGFGWPGGGIMGGGDISPYTDHNLYSSHSAGGASTFAGYRNGYYGSYLLDIPLNNYLRILNSQGNPAPGVAVSLYQRTGPWDWTGHMGVDNTPEISGTTDSSGMFLLPNRSANGGTLTLNGHVLHDNPFGVVDIIGNQGLFLIQLARNDHEEFHWLDITQFNLAYWLGDVISHTFTISSHVPPAGAPLAPELQAVRVEGTWASLDWQPSPSPGVVGYRVYRAAAPQYRYVAASELLADTRFDEAAAEFGDGEHRIYAVTAVSRDGRESGFRELVYAPGLAEPVAVALAPDGSRTVLNNWNLYPLLRQQTDGRYTHRLVNVHYDLGNANYLTYDPAGRLLVSGFGQSPFGRHAVRIYDQDMQPLGAFGDEGSAPGQFGAPAGVALWGPPCTYGGPYELDEHTLLLLDFNGSYTGAQSEIGTPNGTAFTTGRYAQGVSIDSNDTLTYTTAGNLNRTQGAIEFWLRPNWPGNDEQSYTFFEVGDEWFNRMRIMKDGANNLRLMLWDSTTEYGVAYNVGHWQAGEWHHVAATWQGTNIALYVDGRQVGSEGNSRPPDTLASEMYVGSASWEGQQANAVIDELRISDVPRVGNSQTCNRILVADSGNHRIQAFDSLGNFVAEFGSLGSGAGQFNNPQGLAVHSSGRVIVADSGNDRLQLLSFDGANFGFLRSITAGFNGPTGVTTYGQDRIIVADTGNDTIKALVRDGSGYVVVEYSQPNDGHTGPFNAPRGVAVDADGNLVVADTGNQRVVTVRGALPVTRKIWLPLVFRNWGAE